MTEILPQKKKKTQTLYMELKKKKKKLKKEMVSQTEAKFANKYLPNLFVYLQTVSYFPKHKSNEI